MTTSRLMGTVISLGLSLLLATSASGTTIFFEASSIDGGQETPPNGSTAMAGSVSIIMDTDANTLSYNIVITVPPPSGEIMAHIHGFSGPGVPSGIQHNLALGTPKIGVWNFLEAQQANIIAGLTYVNIHSNAFIGGEIRGQITRVPTCGDGILDGPESCDDGNNSDGDCCSSACLLDANGSACAGAAVCENGTCDGAGTCTSAIQPRVGCRSALKSIILLKDDASDDGKDKLIWKWIKGDQTGQLDFGDPTGTTNYALCVYAGTVNTLVTDPEVSADSTFWAPISDKGYKYKDPGGTDDGIQKVILKGGDQGKAKALVKGKGAGLPDPTLGNLSYPVTAQLVNSSNLICFEGVYDSGDEIKNDTSQFKAKAQ